MRECEYCGKREYSNERDFKFCGRCKVVLYCSQKCQRRDWTTHKRICHPPKTKGKSLPQCGLCGARKGPLMRTECCNKLVCDDEDSYVLMSYSREHCSRNHRRYTLCASHHEEKHKGKWQNCEKCKHDSRLPDGAVNYDWAVRAGNNPDHPYKFNFEEDAMKFDWEEEVKYPCCHKCQRGIDTWMDGYSMVPESGPLANIKVVCYGHEQR